jgi:hypothetical protein
MRKRMVSRMKLIIEISDASYETVKNGTWCGSLYEELKNGTPLEESEDCVSRQAVLNLAKFDGRDGLGSIIHAFDVEQLTSVTPAEKVGHWIKIDDCSNSGYYCSECRKRVVKEGWSDTVKIIKYCPNCGAKMEGEQNG